MPECDYCGKSFEDEDVVLQHFADEHYHELGRIDRRRISSIEDNGGYPKGTIALGGISVLVIGVIIYFVFISGGGTGSAIQPHSIGSVHLHGTMEVTVEGEELDLESPDFVEKDQAFHFHFGYADQYGEQIYHLHAQDVSLQYAFQTLGISVNDNGTELTFRNEQYSADDPGTEIRIEVNGEPVEPGTYILDGVGPEDQAAAGHGDDILVEVVTDR